MEEIIKVSGYHNIDDDCELSDLNYKVFIGNAINALSGLNDVKSANRVIEGDGYYATLFGECESIGEGTYADTVNPFAMYIKDFIDENEIPEDHVRLSATSPNYYDWDNPNTFSILEDDLKAITNDNAAARTALEQGRLRLTDIPRELFGKHKAEERAEWLADETSQPDEAARMLLQWFE